MFQSLTQKFQSAFSSLLGSKKITEESIGEAIRQVRLALLDADVNYSVASAFIKKVKEKALGEELIKSVKAGDQFIKIVHDELVALMGGEESGLELNGYPSVILMCGLQGSGKTTQCAKLAHFLTGKNYKKRPFLIACDLQRPAAVEQLRVLGAEISVTVFSVEGEKNPVKVALEGIKQAKKEGAEVVIVDTAGRLHIDEQLMDELLEIKRAVNPNEVLFVASAATGQDAVKTAALFDEKVQITGTILTMLDSSARAGSALSIREITKKPLKFEGIGEKIGDFQLFNPHSMADRILGMGDIINLVKKAEEHFDEEQNLSLEKKLRTASFTYEDYLQQMMGLKKMGSLKGLLKMMPGFNEMEELDVSESELTKMEAIILSMTKAERQGLVEMEPSRRKRVASGSGTHIDDVNRLIKGFKRLKKICKDLPLFKKKMKKDPGLFGMDGMKEDFLKKLF